jgi:ABC-2 type transport system permease protein
VNWQHFKTFLWLRWRLIANRNKRAGITSVVLQGILTAILALAAVGAFFGGIAAGYYALPKAPPEVFMFVWDGVVIAFLFMWMIELLIELQRSELLSLDKFLHLPVSLSGAFVINYLGSISSLGVIIFLPLMIGLSIGLVFSLGPIMLLLFPLIGSFALMVTALTHQFRGWLASLMVNQRRRRTVITIITFSFVLIAQLPNLIGFTSGRWRRRDPITAAGKANQQAIQQLDSALARGEITRAEHASKVKQIRGPERAEERKQVYETVRRINRIVPLGWLPYGAAEGFAGNPWAAVLGMTGLSLIGVVSLGRSYQTTLKLYTGQFTSKTPFAPTVRNEPRTPTTSSAPSKKYSAAFMENKIPRIGEYASAITVSCFRSLLRAPEAKMLLLSPIIMLVIFGGMTYNQNSNPRELLRPLMVAGGYAFMMFMMVGLLGNHFGFDRSGFRVFVLSPAPRKDVLIGKNLSTAPFALGFMFITALALQIMRPMRADHYVAVLLQMIPMYLIFCMVGNVLSMIAPMPMASGSLKPAKPKAMVVLIQMAFAFVFPIAMAPTLIPLGIEFVLSWANWWAWFPAYLIFTMVEVILVVWLYLEVVDKQGQMLARREQKILEVVTAKVE